MSAIAGVIRFGGESIAPQVLHKILGLMQHRSPDGSQTWENPTAAIGHGMLQTTSSSLHETLPLETDRYVITTDVRLDNRQELFDLLGLSNGTTDSNLILAAYQRWGITSPSYLLGDFVYAIWDKQEQRLFCARDHMGTKQLYYVWKNKTCLFASEVQALLPFINPEIDDRRMAQLLLRMYTEKTHTFYKDILRLAPAHTLQISENGLATQSYWELSIDKVHYKEDQQYVERFRELFIEAVRCRLDGNGPIGSYLSGGLDSTSVTCTAQKLLIKDLPVFSATFPSVPTSDEREYLNKVLEQGGYISHIIEADKISPLADMEKMLFHTSSPGIAPNLFMTWNLLALAKKQGIRVMLTGHDGDSVVSHGFGYLGELACQGDWQAFVAYCDQLEQHFDSYGNVKAAFFRNYGIPCLRHLSQSKRPLHLLRQLNQVHQFIKVPRRKLFFEYMIRPNLPAFARGLRYKLGIAKPPRKFDPIISPIFANQNAFVQIAQEISDSQQLIESEQQNHYWMLTSALAVVGSEINDTAAAAFGIEQRHPFFDKRLIEFCVALPPRMKIHEGWTRWILRAAMEGTVPKAIQWRGGKSNLGTSFDEAMWKFEQERMTQAINQLEASSRYYDRNGLQELFNRKELRHSEALWQFIVIDIWLNMLLINKSTHHIFPIG
ncbi:MAG: lasso peptide isopeptide bond-forming cyclase [Anaerolineales bacterium]|nr:lasso peptide isopeptide bond-forming cyclase [Anaerolineales bacterium]